MLSSSWFTKEYSGVRKRLIEKAVQLYKINWGSTDFHGYQNLLTLHLHGNYSTIRPCTQNVLCRRNVKSSVTQSNLNYLNCYHGYHTSTRHCAKVNRGEFQGQRTKPPWRVLFFGTDMISLCTLKALHGNMASSGNLVEHVEVVTIQNQSSNRLKKVNLPVKRFANNVGLTIHNWPVTVSELESRFDVGVLVSFGHMIPDSVIKLFPYGIINMHPSLLPRWRGASPIFHTVLNRDIETGVSISEIRPKHFDIGPILIQRRIPVAPRITTGELTSQLADMGAEIVLECLKDLPNLENLEHEQEDQGVTYAHKVDPKKAGYVNWKEQTAGEIDSHFRAIQGYGNLRYMSHLENGEPVIFTEMVNPDLTKDLDPRDIKYRWGDFLSAPPGSIALQRKDQWLLVKCKDGAVGFTKVVCRSRMTGQTFYHGFCNHKHVQHKFTNEDNGLNKNIFDERVVQMG